jgi:NADH:ubiquinone oxidoreductase subunit 6 (subunit J)
MVWQMLIAIGILASAILAIRSKRLLVSAIWLALTSALTALMIFLLGAPQIAVIELSVGAGLVTVLFVFAINIAGEEPIEIKALVSRPIAWGLLILAAGLAIYLVIPSMSFLPVNTLDTAQGAILWDDRYLDILLQIAIFFSGVLGVLGLLSSGKPKVETEE